MPEGQPIARACTLYAVHCSLHIQIYIHIRTGKGRKAELNPKSVKVSSYATTQLSIASEVSYTFPLYRIKTFSRGYLCLLTSVPPATSDTRARRTYVVIVCHKSERFNIEWKPITFNGRANLK